MLHAAGRSDLPVGERAEHITDLAPILVPNGVTPEGLAYVAIFGGWSGNESDTYEALRRAFDDLPVPADPNASAVRQAGVELFAAKRDEAKSDEKLQSIRGEY